MVFAQSAVYFANYFVLLRIRKRWGMITVIILQLSLCVYWMRIFSSVLEDTSGFGCTCASVWFWWFSDLSDSFKSCEPTVWMLFGLAKELYLTIEKFGGGLLLEADVPFQPHTLYKTWVSTPEIPLPENLKKRYPKKLAAYAFGAHGLGPAPNEN